MPSHPPTPPILCDSSRWIFLISKNDVPGFVQHAFNCFYIVFVIFSQYLALKKTIQGFGLRWVEGAWLLWVQGGILLISLQWPKHPKSVHSRLWWVIGKMGRKHGGPQADEGFLGRDIEDKPSGLQNNLLLRIECVSKFVTQWAWLDRTVHYTYQCCVCYRTF